MRNRRAIFQAGWTAVLTLAIAAPGAARAQGGGAEEGWHEPAAGLAVGGGFNSEVVAVSGELDRFLKAWLVDQDIDRALTYVRRDPLACQEMRDLFELGADQKVSCDTLWRKFLVLWLYGDHGAVEALGHGDPKEPGYATLAVRPDQVPGRLRWRSLDEAVGSLSLRGREPGVYAAFLGLRHAPRDAVFLLIKKYPAGWKVSAISWLAG